MQRILNNPELGTDGTKIWWQMQGKTDTEHHHNITQ